MPLIYLIKLRGLKEAPTSTDNTCLNDNTVSSIQHRLFQPNVGTKVSQTDHLSGNDANVPFVRIITYEAAESASDRF